MITKFTNRLIIEAKRRLDAAAVASATAGNRRRAGVWPAGRTGGRSDGERRGRRTGRRTRRADGMDRRRTTAGFMGQRLGVWMGQLGQVGLYA